MSKERITKEIVQDSNVYFVSEALDCLLSRYGNTLPQKLRNQLYETHKSFLAEMTKDYPKNTDIGNTTLYERIEFIHYK